MPAYLSLINNSKEIGLPVARSKFQSVFGIYDPSKNMQVSSLDSSSYETRLIDQKFSRGPLSNNIADSIIPMGSLLPDIKIVLILGVLKKQRDTNSITWVKSRWFKGSQPLEVQGGQKLWPKRSSL